MTAIGSVDFNYYRNAVYSRPSNREGSAKPVPTMNKYVLIAVPVSLVAVAALVLSFRYPITAESLIGYASVFALLSVAALEYRISWKRLFGRS
jgi:hypothetical protein